MLQRGKTQSFIIISLVDTIEIKPPYREGVAKSDHHTIKSRTTLNLKRG